MLRVFMACFAVMLGTTHSVAQSLTESYIARLSAQDHFNSAGQRLSSAAAIIRQDRANFHRFGIRDPEDESDVFFADEDNRKVLEAMLERGSNSPTVVHPQ